MSSKKIASARERQSRQLLDSFCKSQSSISDERKERIPRLRFAMHDTRVPSGDSHVPSSGAPEFRRQTDSKPSACVLKGFTFLLERRGTGIAQCENAPTKDFRLKSATSRSARPFPSKQNQLRGAGDSVDITENIIFARQLGVPSPCCFHV